MGSPVSAGEMVAILTPFVIAITGAVWKIASRLEEHHKEATEALRADLKADIGQWSGLVIKLTTSLGVVAEDVSYLMGVKDGEDRASRRRVNRTMTTE